MYRLILSGLVGVMFAGSAFAGDVVAIVNPSVSIDKASVGKIYKSELSGFRAFDLPEGDANRETFAKSYTGKSADSLKMLQMQSLMAGRSLPPKVVDSVADMIKAVASTPNGVGYVPSDSVNASVKVIQ